MNKKVFFGYVMNAYAKEVRRANKKVFDEIVSSPLVAETYQKLVNLKEAKEKGQVDEETFKKEKSKLKAQLPAFLYQADCPTGVRKNSEAEPSMFCIIDIDHEKYPLEKWHVLADTLKELKLMEYVVLTHLTPSLEGLRLVLIRPENGNIKQAQAWWAKQLKLEEYDTSVNDLVRLSYAPLQENILYRNDALLFPSEEAVLPSLGEVELPVVEEVKKATEKPAPTPKAQQPVEAKKWTLIDLARVEKNLGVKIQDIVTRYWEKTGMPYEGSRNTRLADLAAQVRYVVDYDTETVAEILRHALPADVAPLEEAEYQSIARSMCKQERTPMSHLMREILGELSAEQHNVKASFIYFAEEMPKLPKRLPKVLYEWTKGAPDMYLPTLCNSFFPAAAIYCVDFKVKYLVDGFYYEPHFSELRLGPQSNGKSNNDKFVKTFHQAIRAQDKISLEKIAEYQTKLKNGEKVEELLALVRYLSTNTTMAALLQQLIWNQQVGNYSSFVMANELYQFYRMSDKDPFTLFRLAYDQGELSANRATLDAVRGVVEHFRMNVLVSSTIPDAQAFFHGHILDGTLSRFSISYLPRQEYGVQPKPFKVEMLSTLNERMKPYVANLESAHGAIQCKEIDRMTQRVLNEVYTVSSLIRNDAFDELLRRSVQIGFMKACLLYAANGMKWEKEIEDFVFWSVRSDMWAKMRYFSDEYEQESKRVKTCKKGPQNLLLLLPNHFTMEEAARVLKSQGKDEKKVKNMLKTWKHRQFIAEERNSSDSISYYKLKYNTGE